MSDDLSEDFRVGAEPLVVDAVSSRLEVPNTPLISMTYKDIVDLFWLERSLHYKMADFEEDKKAFRHDADMMPSRWDDYDPEKTQEILDTVSDLLTLVKDQVQDWPVYEEIAQETQLLDPGLDKDGVQITLQKPITARKIKGNIRVGKSTKESKRDLRRFVEIFGHFESPMIEGFKQADDDIKLRPATFITTSDIIDLLEKRIRLQGFIKSEEANPPLPEAGCSIIDLLRSIVGTSKASEYKEAIADINAELSFYQGCGVDVKGIEDQFDKGDLSEANVHEHGTNKCHIMPYPF